MSRPEGHDADEDAGSPPCYLHELDAAGLMPVDSQQLRDVLRWRKAERERLIGIRQGLDPGYRATQTQAMTANLDLLIRAIGAAIVSVYWPIRGEPDLRSWMQQKHAEGVRVALPQATALGQPLVFREWQPEAPMAQGLWRIPFPASGAILSPSLIIAPTVGFDTACYRLGYGGGFFDRTLASMSFRPRVIGLGFPETAIATIFPQPHDVVMDWIVTGSEAQIQRPGGQHFSEP